MSEQDSISGSQHHGNGMTWREFYEAMERRDERLDDKLNRIISAVEEERDSQNAMHLRFEGLPCAQEQDCQKRILAEIAELRMNSIPWRRLLTPKIVGAVIGAGLTWVGWESAAQAVKKIFGGQG